MATCTSINRLDLQSLITEPVEQHRRRLDKPSVPHQVSMFAQTTVDFFLLHTAVRMYLDNYPVTPTNLSLKTLLVSSVLIRSIWSVISDYAVKRQATQSHRYIPFTKEAQQHDFDCKIVSPWNSGFLPNKKTQIRFTFKPSWCIRRPIAGSVVTATHATGM